MYEHTVEFQPASYVLGGLTAENREGFYEFLGQCEVSWGTNSYTIISAKYLLDCLEEWAMMGHSEDDEIKFIINTVDERITAKWIDLEN